MFPILVLLAVVSGFPLFAQPADVVVENAVIYTMDARIPKASSLAVKDGRFLAVGEVKAHIGPQTKRLDAKGAAIVPGLIDSHVHMRGLGEMLESFDFRHARSVEEITRALAGRAAATPKGEWIQGRNWDQTNWGGRFPTADEISKAVPDHPVYLRRVDGHAAWVNRKALEIAGVTRETKDPAGGQILRDASGAPAGVLVDRAMGLVARHIPARTPAQVERALALAAKKCAELGLTGVHDAGISRVEWEAYQKLKARGELPVRVYAMVGGAGDWWRSLKEPVIDAHLSLRCLKLLVDGAMGSRGAAFWQPYADDKQNSGLLLLTK
nr:amidohydrolase family protein [Bryobacter sp.]